jgi:hypothetical protein
MALFLLLTGLVLALGAGEWIAAVTFTSTTGRLLRLAVGLVLIGFGLWQVRGKSLTFPWLNRAMQPLWTKQAQLHRRQTMVSYGLYGFGYGCVSFQLKVTPLRRKFCAIRAKMAQKCEK